MVNLGKPDDLRASYSARLHRQLHDLLGRGVASPWPNRNDEPRCAEQHGDRRRGLRDFPQQPYRTTGRHGQLRRVDQAAEHHQQQRHSQDRQPGFVRNQRVKRYGKGAYRNLHHRDFGTEPRLARHGVGDHDYH